MLRMLILYFKNVSPHSPYQQTPEKSWTRHPKEWYMLLHEESRGWIPHSAFSRLLCTWTYWGSLFHVFKQGWWLGTPKFSFETADVDNDNALYLKKRQICLTNSDARISVLYLQVFYVFIGGKVMYLGFYWECEIWGNFLCVLVQCDQHQSFPFHPFQTIAKKRIERKAYILRWFA